MSILNERMLPRQVVRQFDCPECGAGEAEACIGARGKPRLANHMARVVVAEQTLRPEPVAYGEPM